MVTATRITFDIVSQLLPKRDAAAHKGDFGKLLMIAGGERYIGAATLSTLAALRSGVGLCTLAAPERVIASVAVSAWEAIYLALEEEPAVLTGTLAGSSAVTMGMGMGHNARTAAILAYVLQNANCPIILDADGINCAADNISIVSDTKAEKRPLILTPHPGELARLMRCDVRQVQADREGAAYSMATDLGCIMVLKGADTVIASPDGTLLLNPTGNAGLARGGSGDVLSGMIGALCAQGLSPLDAAIAGVYLHGLAADRVAERTSMQGMLPSDVIGELAMVFRLFEKRE